MKRIMFFLSADAQNVTGTTAATKPEPVYESQKLTELQNELAENFAKTSGLKVGEKAWSDAMLLVYKTQKLIDAEIAAIKKSMADAALAEQRNKRIALVTDFETAAIANAILQADKKASEDDKKASNDKLAALRETLQNEVLGSLRVQTVKPSTDKPAGQAKGATTERIRAAFIANRNAGMNDTENVKAIIASGESRGTTGAVVLAYQREIGEK